MILQVPKEQYAVLTKFKKLRGLQTIVIRLLIRIILGIGTGVHIVGWKLTLLLLNI
jgi:hypothetical protein